MQVSNHACTAHLSSKKRFNDGGHPYGEEDADRPDGADEPGDAASVRHDEEEAAGPDGQAVQGAEEPPQQEAVPEQQRREEPVTQRRAGVPELQRREEAERQQAHQHSPQH